MSVGALGVIGQLLGDRAAEVEAHGAGQVEDADRRIGQFDLRHLAIGQVIVHQVLAVAFQRFAQFGMTERDAGREECLLLFGGEGCPVDLSLCQPAATLPQWQARVRARPEKMIGSSMIVLLAQ